MPALGPHHLRHLGTQECDLREGAPGPAEVGPDAGRLSADRAAGEDEAERLLFGRRGRRDVAVLADEDRAAFEEGRRGPEDEVHVAGDRAALEILAATVQEHGILPAQEAAIAEDGAVAVDTDRERLPDGTGGVLEAQLLRGEVVRVDHRRCRPEGPGRLAVDAPRVHVEVEADDRRLRILAHERQESLLALDEDALPVDTRPDLDDPALVGAAGRCGRDRGLQRLELAAAVGGDDGVRVRQPAGRRGQRKRRRKSEGQERQQGSLHVAESPVPDHVLSRYGQTIHAQRAEYLGMIRESPPSLVDIGLTLWDCLALRWLSAASARRSVRGSGRSAGSR